MIKPHGAEELKPLYVEDDAVRTQLLEEAAGLPSVVVSSAAASSAVMLGSGYFTPLTGFMDATDAKFVAATTHTAAGLLWPTPVVNMVPSDQVPEGVAPGSRIALLDPNVDGNPVLAIQEVTEVESLASVERSSIIFKSLARRTPPIPE